MATAETNGITTYYKDAGNGPAVVFIHGHSVDLRMWDEQVDDVVAAGFRAVRYDVRGHGRSSAPRQGYRWDNYSADLAALLDHLGIGSAHLAGSSMGGGGALVFAVRYPSRVRSLTLVDSTLPGYTYSPEFVQWIIDLRTAYRAEGASAFERLWLAHSLFDGVRRFPERFARVREAVLAFPAAEYQADYPGEPGYEQPDVPSHLHEIAAPALVIVGEHDLEDFHLVAEILAAELPDARKVAMTDAWHLPSMERPEEFNRLLVEFLRGIESKGGPS